MKRGISIAMVVVFGTVAVHSASAKSGSSGSHHSSGTHTIMKQSSPSKYMGGTPSGCAPSGTPENPSGKNGCCSDCCKHDCCHDHCGKDDSNKNPIVNTIHPIVNNNPATPVSSNGFVWAGDHWERPRAGQATVVDPNLGSGPIVRDHTLATLPYQGGHMGSSTLTTNAPGGVTVTGGSGFNGLPGKVRDHRGTSGTNDVTGVGASPVDSAVQAIGNVGSAALNGLTDLGNVFGIGSGSITPAGDDSHFHDHRHP